MALGWLWGDTPRPRTEKTQQDGRCWSGACTALERLWGDTPHPRAKEKPQQDGRRGEIMFRIKPHTHQSRSEGSSTRTQRPYRNWDKTVLECLLWRYGSAVDCRKCRGSGCSRLGYGINPLGMVTINSTTELPELTQDWGKDSWRAQTEPCVHQDAEERSSDPTRDWPRLAHECPGVSSRGVGQWWPAAGLGAPSAEVCEWDLLREVTITFITSTIIWTQVNNREGTKLHLSTENWIKDLLSMAPPIRTRISFPLSQSLPSGRDKPLP